MRPSRFMTEDSPSSTHDEAPELVLSPHAWAHGGHTVARTEQGRVVFVRHADVGEVVRVRLTDYEPAAKYWRADVVEVHQASVFRREKHPWMEADAIACARSGEAAVGGAEFGHLDLKRQHDIKTDILRQLLGSIGRMQPEKLAALDPHVTALDGDHPLGLEWRTRAHFAINDHGAVSMHAYRSGDLKAVGDFPLMVPALRQLPVHRIDFTGIERLDLVAPSAGSDQSLSHSCGPLVLLTACADCDAASALQAAERVSSALRADDAGISVVLDRGHGVVEEPTVISGQGYVHEQVDGFTWQVSAGGFWQIHRRAPAMLLQAVAEAVDLQPGDSVVDLYAGAGLFTVPFAHAVGASGTVIAVEGSAVTTKDAAVNVRDYQQVTVVRGSVERVLSSRGARRYKAFSGLVPDVVFLDPPRSGAGKPVVDAINALRPRRVVYLSCDPATLARDVARFSHHGWSVEAIRGFDMYPNTHHMETLVTLVR